MPLVFLLLFGGALVAYMGWKNVSFKGVLSDTLDPISGSVHDTQPIDPFSGTPGTGSLIASLFPIGSKYTLNRHDQGRDIQGPANAPVLAPGNGVVIRNGYDPNGFGISYPIVHFTSGIWKGLDIYFGHIQSNVTAGQKVIAGDTIGMTQNGSGPYVGNATSPGWIEIGLAPQGSPGSLGQILPPGL